MHLRIASLLAYIGSGCAAASLVLSLLEFSSLDLRGAELATASVVSGLLTMGTFFPLLPLTDALPAATWARTTGVLWIALSAGVGTLEAVAPGTAGFLSGVFLMLLPLAALWLAATSWNGKGPRALWGGVAALGAVTHFALFAVAASQRAATSSGLRVAILATEVPFVVWLLLVGREFRTVRAPEPSTVPL
ncbi:MAG: hypothetical protein LC620_05320 [Halobacteriales archaeon]|nr:hypothetical protein [Halobacteriales archaeon]